MCVQARLIRLSALQLVMSAGSADLFTSVWNRYGGTVITILLAIVAVHHWSRYIPGRITDSTITIYLLSSI
jgi:hypothetical protein